MSYRRPDNKLLLNLKYTPLRKEFQNTAKRTINRDANTVMIILGGGDASQGLTLKIVDALEQIDKKLKCSTKFTQEV